MSMPYKREISCIQCRFCVKVVNEPFLKCKEKVWTKKYVILTENEYDEIGAVTPRYRKMFKAAQCCQKFDDMSEEKAI